MILLLNSAVMPDEGYYKLKRIDSKPFTHWLKKAYEEGKLKSYISHMNAIDFVKRLTGITVELNPDEKTVVETGDTLLIIRTKQRRPGKGINPKDEDYEFFICEYSKSKDTFGT
jgi:hypothetical protein